MPIVACRSSALSLSRLLMVLSHSQSKLNKIIVQCLIERNCSTKCSMRLKRSLLALMSALIMLQPGLAGRYWSVMMRQILRGL